MIELIEHLVPRNHRWAKAHFYREGSGERKAFGEDGRGSTRELEVARRAGRFARNPLPDMRIPLRWEDVKSFFVAEASRLLQGLG